jgi:ABC-type branched-subunit amino acid transport system ATPase component
MLQTKKLKKHFQGIKAVDGLSITLTPGKLTGIVGPNGSGKSTLVNTLTGVHEMTSGSVMIGKHTKLSKIKPYSIKAYGITRTFQDVRLFEQMTVLDNVLVVLTERGVFSSLFEKHTSYHLDQAQVVLERVGLWFKKGELAVNLSYGQRKLLEVARVIAMDSDVVLFDEPFAGLFKEMVDTLVEIMQELVAQGRTVVLIEHNMDLIRKLCDHLIVMDAGKLLAEGDPREVLEQPDVIEAYLGL